MIIPDKEFIEEDAVKRLEKWFFNDPNAEVLYYWKNCETYYFTVKCNCFTQKNKIKIYFIKIIFVRDQWLLSEDKAVIIKR